MALTTHLPITHRLNVRELTSGACDAIFKVTGEMKNDSLSQSASMHAYSRTSRRTRLVSELASGTGQLARAQARAGRSRVDI